MLKDKFSTSLAINPNASIKDALLNKMNPGLNSKGEGAIPKFSGISTWDKIKNAGANVLGMFGV